MSQLTDDDINNKKRNVEINVYYEKKYNSYLDVLKYFILYIVGLLILAILRKRYYLSYGLTNILTFCLVIIGSMHIYVKIADINARNNINFDEYDWAFDPSEQSDPNKLDNSSLSQNDGTGLACVESECCDPADHKWCPTTGKCVSTGNYSVEACDPDYTASVGQTSVGQTSLGQTSLGKTPPTPPNTPHTHTHRPSNGNPSFAFDIHAVTGQHSTTSIQDREAIDHGFTCVRGDDGYCINNHIQDHFVGKYVLNLKKNFSDTTNSIFNKNVYSNNETTNINSICQYDRNFATV